MINERIKELRAFSGLNQRDFSAKAKIGHSTLAMFETGQRVPKDIHISQICQAFNVNEEWLRNGTGEMFRQDEKTILSQLATEYNLDDLDRRIIESYLKMGEPQRKAIKDYIKTLSDTLASASEIDMEVEDYRRELEQEKSIQTSSASQSSDEKAI